MERRSRLVLGSPLSLVNLETVVALGYFLLCPLKIRLRSLAERPRAPRIDRRQLEPVLRAQLDDWHGLLGRHVAQARQILRKLLVGYLVVTPDATRDGRHAEVAGTGTLGKFLSGVILPKGMASPSIPSWNQILGWLRQMDLLRKASGQAA